MPRPPYASKGWRDVRKFVLARDGHLCKIQLPGCLGRADCVDHVLSVNLGGAWLDPANLRAACTPCNSRRGNGSAERHTDVPPSRDWLNLGSE